MKIKDILFTFLGAMVIIFATVLITLPAFAEQRVIPDAENKIDPFIVEVVGTGQYVKQNETGLIFLDGTKKIRISLNNSYRQDFTYEVFDGSNSLDLVLEETISKSGEIIDLSNVFSGSEDKEYLIIVSARKIGFDEVFLGSVLVNIENLSVSISFLDNSLNPKQIILVADKDVVFHWSIEEYKNDIITGVAQESLDAQLDVLPNGEYKIKNIAILSTKYHNQFEFECQEEFTIERENLLNS